MSATSNVLLLHFLAEFQKLKEKKNDLLLSTKDMENIDNKLYIIKNNFLFWPSERISVINYMVYLKEYFKTAERCKLYTILLMYY